MTIVINYRKDNLLKKDTGRYKMLLKIHPETSSDYSAITEVNNLDFGQLNEGKKLEEVITKNKKLG